MKTDKLLPTVDSPLSDPGPGGTRSKPRVFAVLLFAAAAFYFSSHSIASLLPQARIESERPAQLTLLHQACQQRFWRLKALPYCQRALEAPWVDGGHDGEATPLEVLQVYTPPKAEGRFRAPTPEGLAGLGYKECSQVLMEHTFGWSYGRPFVGQYSPPTGCNWTNVIFNLSMTSKGRQYDRLGHLFLGDIEVWRTSTAEPNPGGIVFNYTKDMTHLGQLLREPQKVIFDLGNLVNDVYTGSFTARLTAVYYLPSLFSAVQPANEILPITARRAARNQPSHFRLPSERAVVTPRFPANAIRAVVSISASGNADEEFWYANVPSAYTQTFPDSPLPGYGPFREIQVLVDGAPAGFVWPFTNIYTGGIVPSLWRPVVAPYTYDLPEYEIDISPFLPLLLNGSAHTVELAVVTYDPDTNSVRRRLGSDWLVSGRIHVWTDPRPDWETTGSFISANSAFPRFSYAPVLAAGNTSLSVHLAASRDIFVSSDITTSTGTVTQTWTQALSYSSHTTISNGGNTQALNTTTSVLESAGSFGSRAFQYGPLALHTTFTPGQKSFGISAGLQLEHSAMSEGKWTDGIRAREAGLMATRLRGTASWVSNSGGRGRTEQAWAEVRQLRDSCGVANYGRKVVAANDRVVRDYQIINNVLVGEDDPEAARDLGRLNGSRRSP